MFQRPWIAASTEGSRGRCGIPDLHEMLPQSEFTSAICSNCASRLPERLTNFVHTMTSYGLMVARTYNDAKSQLILSVLGYNPHGIFAAPRFGQLLDLQTPRRLSSVVYVCAHHRWGRIHWDCAN
jgi:hypothetical protein